jgi:hypothetical protein
MLNYLVFFGGGGGGGVFMSVTCRDNNKMNTPEVLCSTDIS